jgi:hypothetical protein
MKALEMRGIHVIRGQLLQHFLMMMKASENARYSTLHLGEAGDKHPESLPRLLPHRMEVGLYTVLLVSTGEVRNELRAKLFPGVD